MERKIRVIQRRNGHKVSFLTMDRGKPGLTPLEERWYKSNMDTGWQKDMPADERRALMLKAHGGDVLASARALIALHNVTTDPQTKVEAHKDASYFFKMHRRNRFTDYRYITKNTMPISPRQRPISRKQRRLT